jgi:hypothetical protein
MKRLLACLLVSFGLSQSGFAQTGCGEIQKAFDQINTVYRFGAASASSWATVQQIFGAPTQTTEVSGRVSTFIYAFRGCSLEFEIGSEGKIETKKFRLVASQSTPSGPVTSVQPLRAPAAATVNNTNQTEVAEAIKSLDATLQQLKTQISDLERVLRAMPVTQPQAVAVPPATGNAPNTATPIPADINRFVKTSGSSEQQVQTSPSAPSTAINPVVAENGSYKGEISEATGRPKDVYVNGYYRKDGTYVRGHYRSAPRK